MAGWLCEPGWLAGWLPACLREWLLSQSAHAAVCLTVRLAALPAWLPGWLADMTGQMNAAGERTGRPRLYPTYHLSGRSSIARAVR